MKYEDFLSDPDFWKPSKPPLIKASHQSLEAKKEDALFARLEEIEGKVLTYDQVKEHVRVEMRPGVDNKQMIYWKGKPILFFEWDKLDNLKVYKI